MKLSLRLGLLLAAIMAGPPLYSLVQQNRLDGQAAFERGLVVAIACAIGAGLVMQIAYAYRAALDEQAEKEARAARIERLLDAAEELANQDKQTDASAEPATEA